MAIPDSMPRPPDDFSDFLKTDTPVLLVGGQAVNLWALYYNEVTVDLAPFVSCDIDVFGQRETLKSIAKLAGLKPNYFPLKPPSNEVGYIMPKDASDSPMIIEVLRWVKGVSEDELEVDSVIFKIGKGNVPVKVPSPVTLLKAKLANLTGINQQGRQDAKHVLILFKLLPSYLRDIAGTVRSGKRTEREFVIILDRLLELVGSEVSAGIFTELNLTAVDLFKDLPEDGLPKITAFKKHQLSRKLSGLRRGG